MSEKNSKFISIIAKVPNLGNLLRITIKIPIKNYLKAFIEK
jgi:hypothetical protein